MGQSVHPICKFHSYDREIKIGSSVDRFDVCGLTTTNLLYGAIQCIECSCSFSKIVPTQESVSSPRNATGYNFLDVWGVALF